VAVVGRVAMRDQTKVTLVIDGNKLSSYATLCRSNIIYTVRPAGSQPASKISGPIIGKQTYMVSTANKACYCEWGNPGKQVVLM